MKEQGVVFPLNPLMAATEAPPVMEARRWLEGVVFPPDRPLLNVSQAAPVEPPPEGLRRAVAEAALNEPEAHLYGPVLGLPELRAELATRWSAAYGGEIAAGEVAITSGCNQAFCAVMATIAGPGDEVILPTPWYFNHKMWLDMSGVRAVALPQGAGLLPDPEDGRAGDHRPDPGHRARLAQQSGRGGVSGRACRRLPRSCARAGIALVLDETYRDFDSRPGAPHDLFADPDWAEVLVHLYSFSKAYRLTGHRVGAMVAHRARLAEVEKVLDTVTICPNQLGQRAALWGMRNLGQWLAGERDEILARRAAMEAGIADLEGWRMLGCGAYFAYVEHPFDLPSDEVARRLVREAGVLMLPGTMFTPEGDAAGRRQMRIAFANVDRAGIGALVQRLARVRL
jgi:aspartate/methionine/tyrosine aminotransferase